MSDGDSKLGGADVQGSSCVPEPESPHRLLERALALNAVFNELNVNENRTAFLLSGIVDDGSQVYVLQGLDAMSRILFPKWTTSESERLRNYEFASLHLKFLFSASDLAFNLDQRDSQIPKLSYSTWLKLICEIDRRKLCHKGPNSISQDNWAATLSANETIMSEEEVKSLSQDSVQGKPQRKSKSLKRRKQKSCRLITSSSESSSSESRIQSMSKCDKMEKLKSQKRTKHKSSKLGRSSSESELSEGNLSSIRKCDRLRKNNCLKRGKRKSCKLVTSSSESDSLQSNLQSTGKCDGKDVRHSKFSRIETSESSIDFSVDSSDSSASNVEMNRTRLKEVVVPQKFNNDDSYCLKKYLARYERYFRAQFNGTQRECSQQLGEFLSGEAKEAYDALRGDQVKYKYLKPKLIEWFTLQRDRKVHRKKFDQMQMNIGEALHIYCIRLENHALRAYPNDPKKLSRALKEKIRLTAPLEFVNLLERKKELKQLMKLGKSISWGDILELAVEDDKKRKEKQTHVEKARTENVGHLEGRSDMLSASAASSIQNRKQVFLQNVNVISNQCSSCSKIGHTSDICRKRLGQCLLCGSYDHWLRECCKYQEEYGRASLNTKLNVDAPIFEPRMDNWTR